MLVKIKVDGTYSDFKRRPGFVRSQNLTAGTTIDFPGEYARGLVDVGLAEFVSEQETITFEVVEEAPKPILTITDTAKRQLDKYQIDPVDVTGTGRGGKITLRDANKYVAKYLEEEKAKAKQYIAAQEA